VRRWLVIGPATIVLFDLVASIGARVGDFDYRLLAPGSLILTTGIAFLAAQDLGRIRPGVIVGAVTATTEATVGWAASWLIGPGAPEQGDRGAWSLVVAAIFVIALGFLEGSFGGLLGRAASRRKRDGGMSTERGSAGRIAGSS